MKRAIIKTDMGISGNFEWLRATGQALSKLLRRWRVRASEEMRPCNLCNVLSAAIFIASVLLYWVLIQGGTIGCNERFFQPTSDPNNENSIFISSERAQGCFSS